MNGDELYSVSTETQQTKKMGLIELTRNLFHVMTHYEMLPKGQAAQRVSKIIKDLNKETVITLRNSSNNKTLTIEKL